MVLRENGVPTPDQAEMMTCLMRQVGGDVWIRLVEPETWVQLFSVRLGRGRWEELLLLAAEAPK